MANYGGAAASVAMTQQGAPTATHLQANIAQSGIQLPTGGIRTAMSNQHPFKKARVDGLATIAAPSPGGLTSRLGVTMPMGGIQANNLSHPGQLSGNPSVSGISLPVGVGIRLGGAGGVAPTTAQNAARATVPGQFHMWGGLPGAGMSDGAIAERRQRNREHAKRSRVRKKFMLESLQEQVLSLQHENAGLRVIIQDNIPEHAQKIIAECCSTSPLFADDGTPLEQKSRGETALVRSDFNLMECLATGQQNFVLSDPRLPDNPIVFATPGFYKLTGYTQEQVLGRNCRFLQGPGTNPKTVDIIRKAIASGADATVCILNYKADGTPFWNQFFVAALRDSDNCIVNYVSLRFGWSRVELVERFIFLIPSFYFWVCRWVFKRKLILRREQMHWKTESMPFFHYGTKTTTIMIRGMMITLDE
jgi:PAS domain S-box-containing protein